MVGPAVSLAAVAGEPRGVGAVRDATVIVLGAGGNIGSHLVPHIARMAAVRRVILVDRGRYEPANLATQNILSSEVGRTKATVQASRLLAIEPGLSVVPMVSAVEAIPLGRLRGDVLLSCLDTRASRMHVNELAVHLGIPWVDAGVAVLADDALTRVTTYLPGEDQPCMVCGWDSRDFALVEQAYPCLGAVPEAPASGAPSHLGALAAAMQARACEALLRGASADGGRQVLVGAAHHAIRVTRYLRNPECRLGDHAAWSLAAPLRDAGAVSIAGVFELGRGGEHDPSSLRLSVEGGRFELGALCRICGYGSRRLRLRRLPELDAGGCPQCLGTLVAAGPDLVEAVSLDMLAPADGSRTLHSIGVRSGDIVRLSGSGTSARFEVDGGYKR